MRLLKCAVAAFVLFAVTSCANDLTSDTTLDPTTSVPSDPVMISPSESGMTGSVISISEQNPGPLPGTEIRLAKAYWNDDRTDGAFVIDETTSPITITDDNGKFAFTSIEARDYVIVIGDLYGQNVIFANADGSARIYTTELGSFLDVGVLQVDLASAPSFPATPVQAYPPPVTSATPYIYP